MSDDTLQEEQLAHAPLGPSSAEGWSTCADYVNANRGLPNHDTPASAEGTFAHIISDQALSLGMDAYDFIGMTVKIADWTFRWEEDDADLLQPGIEFARSLPGEFLGEHRVSTSQWTLPGQFGTLDRAVIHHDVATLIDLKWGRGVPVSPIENKQVMLYGLGWLSDHGHRYPKVDRFQFIIDQPRHAGGGGFWECTRDELLAFGEWIRGRAALTAEPNPSRTASLKGCQWCRRRRAPGGCSTFDRFIADLLDQRVEEMDIAMIIDGQLALPALSLMTPERRSFILSHKKMIIDWLEIAAEQELRDALAGGETPGRKPVPGNKTPTKWRDRVKAEDAVRQHIGDLGFNQKIKTPLQLKSVISAEEYEALDPLIDPGERRPTMVSDDDARDRFVPLAVDDLPDLLGD